MPPEISVAENVALNPVLMMIILVILVGISAFLLGYYMKKRLFIVQRERK